MQDYEKNLAVLIETLWNVKVQILELFGGIGSRFNRNIVECKGTAMGEAMLKIIRFNRNIVECKGRTDS